MTPREQEITRSISARPSTFSEATRSVEITVATGADVGDGFRLAMDRLPDYGPGPVPVMLDHANSTDRMAGRLDSLRLEAGQLIGRAVFADAPAADDGLALARSGIAASVRASVSPENTRQNADGTIQAMRWRLRHVALTPEGADPLAITRSAHPNPSPSLPSETMDDQTQALDPQPTRAELRREAALLRAASAAGWTPEETETLIRSDKNETEALMEVIRSRRLAQEATSSAGHPASIPVWGDAINRSAGLAEVAEKALRGQPLDAPLPFILRNAGYSGRTDEDLMRSALTGRPDRYISRSGGMHSSSDFPALLLGAGDRLLQERYAAPPRGVRALARIRPLQDFREVSVIDVGMIGDPKAIGEGGEITFTSIAESQAKYKAKRYGYGLAMTYEAMRNDDLGGLGVALEESVEAHLGVEADSLVALLSGNGATAPDGRALFHADHANSVAAAMTVDGLAAAVKLLRAQKSIGGRLIAQDPGFLLVGPEREAEAAALLSDLWQATTAEDVNPWRSLQLLVEPSLSGLTYYMVAAGPRKPFELGQLVGLPRVQQEEDFSTSSIRFKSESAHGVGVADHRPLVRCTTPT
jgi:hypothetical protein